MKNKYLLLVCIIFSLGIVRSMAQGVGIGNPNFSPVSCSILELRSSNQGFLISRISWSNLPASPTDGLLVYINAGAPTDGFGFYYYDGPSSSWIKIGRQYTAGTGINITAGGQIINTAPDQAVSLTGAGATTISGSYPNFTVSSTDNNTTYSAGSGLSLTGTTFSNTAPDQTITINGGGSTSVSGSYPNFTVTSTGTSYTAGAGINITGTVISNTAPNQTVSIIGGGSTTVSGSYPNFTVSSTDNNTTYTAGNGLSLTGTSFALSAPVSIANGGTNSTSFTASQFLWYNGTSIVSSGYTSGNLVATGTTNQTLRHNGTNWIANSLFTVNSDSSAAINAGSNKGYLNFGATYGYSGFGFRSNSGTLEYKFLGGTWTPFPAPPPAGSQTEWWYRPSGMPYIQPLTNANVRIYDVTSQPYGIYYDGGTNTVGGYFRTTSGVAGTTAIQGFSDVAGQQQYGYLGYNGPITVGSTSINGASVYGWTNDPNSTGVYGRTTGNASVAAILGYSNVWIPGYFYCDNATGTFNPPALYGQLNVTSTTLGGFQSGVRGYNNRGTTAGNPGYSVGVEGTSVSQNQDAFGVLGTSYSNQGAGATYNFGGYFDSYNYAGITGYGYAYVGGRTGGSNRKIEGSGSVNEIIPTENHGRITLVCSESPEYWYTDYGTVKLVDGKAHVELDPILADIIIVDEKNPLKVFAQVNIVECKGVAIVNKSTSGFDIIELNSGTSSGEIDYQIVAKPKTNYGEGRFVQAPGPAWLKKEKEPVKAKAANQGNGNIFNWPSDWEVYGYEPGDVVGVGSIVPAGINARKIKVAEGSFINANGLPVKRFSVK